MTEQGLGMIVKRHAFLNAISIGRCGEASSPTSGRDTAHKIMTLLLLPDPD